MNNAIIAIVISVAAGIVVLAVEYNFFNPKHSVSVPGASKSNAPSVADANDPEKDKKNTVVSPTRENSVLAELHSTAKGLSSSYNRDLELNRLVDYGINKGELDYAVEIAKDLCSTYGRDLALAKLVDKCLALKKFHVATRAAQSMSSSYNRDLHLSRVLKARQEHDERPNPGALPTPASGRG